MLLASQVGFVVDKVALGQVFSEYFGFPCQSSFHQLLHNHPHLSSGAGTIVQKWPQYKGLSPTPLALKNTVSLSHFCEPDFMYVAAQSWSLIYMTGRLAPL
jgi:hypothetical protein